MALKPILLMAVAISILVIPGMLYNNLNNTGLAPAQTLSCPGWPDVTCQGSVSVGCNVNSAYCTLSGQSISFLSITSPFTQLLQGNIFGVFNQITSGTSSASLGHGPFDPVGNSQYILGNCIVDDGTGGTGLGLTGLHFDLCTQSNSDGTNTTKASATTWNNWNTNWVSKTSATPFFSVKSNASITLTCNYNIQLNFTFSGTAYDGQTWYGCDYGNPTGGVPVSEKTQTTWSFLIAVPFAQGKLDATTGTACSYVAAPGKCFHLQFPVQLESWETMECAFSSHGTTRTTYNYLISPQCDQWYSNIHSSTQSTGASFGLFTPIITFIVGLALFFLGTGISMSAGGSILGTGTTFGLGSNEQGTRMAQMIGMGLILWSPLYSEFATWFTTGLLPYGLDGATGIMSLLLTGLFFFGIFWALQSRGD